ncbi:TonB-dependent receptor [Microbulbifer sp. 2205BS26-8]|uniref:TonB-dependent receptor n=1 Tax=Microbulbifer sp. 2205BS26-8 TaxID=3064386 RepID=UPI00273D2F7A|nr:TonB-dependent receptor [Microbulbifer sp. 2205BS26-8]MDP5210163.1 TonB-dependent receptor [Microbulbifer sp. 2205BS26-8]
MRLNVSKRLLCAAIGMAVTGQLQAAGLKLDLYVDAEPAGQIEILLNGEHLGSTDVRGSFWSDAIPSGRHRLQLGLEKESESYAFTVTEDEAALVTINTDSETGRSVKSIQKMALSAVDEHGFSPETFPSENLAPGVIQGTVSTLDGEQPLRNVTVTVVGSSEQTVTDRYGNFELQLAPGNYQLQLEHPDYQTAQLNALRVLSKINLALDVQLSTADVFAGEGGDTLEEVQVLGRYLPGNPIEIERVSSSVVDSIDFTQIARFDDSMVSSALKRVVGVTLEEDRFPIVRGMKSRYQSTDFNGAFLPSTDPARRDLPLDIFPAGIMQGLSLQKSASADVPSSATAGHISMRTKEAPQEGFFQTSYSASHGDMHGDGLLMSGTEGDRDWLGMDDGTRELPDELGQTLFLYLNVKQDPDSVGEFTEEDIQRIARSIPHNRIEKGEAQIDSSISFSGGNSWDIGEQNFGFISAVRYSSKWSNNTKQNTRYAKFNEELDIDSIVETHDTNNVIDLSAMLNLEWNISDQHRLGLNNIALRHTTNSAEISIHHAAPSSLKGALSESQIEEIKANLDLEKFLYQNVDWIEEQLLSHQLWGEHSFSLPSRSGWMNYLGDLEVQWQLMEATSEYDRPNATQYSYRRVNGSSYSLNTANFSQYNFWEEMEEDLSGNKLDIALPIEGFSWASLVLKGGLLTMQRDRDGAYHHYQLKNGSTLPPEIYQNPDPTQVYAPENIAGSPGSHGFYLSIGRIIGEKDVGFSGDSYIAEQEIDAAYGLIEMDIQERFKVNVGVRKEKYRFLAEQYAYTPEPLVELLDKERTFPSVSVTYLLNDQWQLRTAYSETVSWPEIYEIMPRVFYDIETLERYSGNPELKPADIDNIDIRLEWYPSESESITLAYFTKDMINAIENRFAKSGDVFDFYTFDNAEKAEAYGWELDLRREFTLGRDQGHEVFVQFNYAGIHSEVKTTGGPDLFPVLIKRGLQGQPDYVTNLQLGYDHIDSGQEVTLVFSRKGRELAIANPGLETVPSDVYELPYNDLRLIYKKNFLNGLSLSASIDNLLDEEHQMVYDGYKTPYLNYSSGRKFKLKASYSY